jgi:hypothetical protein
MRTEFLAGKVQSLLDRLTPPSSMQGKPQAQADEIAALMRAVASHAPTVGYDEWWPRFEDALLGNRRARVWPSLSAWHDAGRAAGSSAKGTPDAIARGNAAMRDGWCQREGRLTPDAAAIWARRMTEGECCDDAVYGSLAAEIEERELVPREVMARWRSRSFLDRRAIYGQSAALAWETEAKARHAQAVEVRQQRAARDAEQQRQEWVA